MIDYRANEKVPALHKISQDSFKDDVLEHLKENPFVIVFAEQTVSFSNNFYHRLTQYF